MHKVSIDLTEEYWNFLKIDLAEKCWNLLKIDLPEECWNLPKIYLPQEYWNLLKIDKIWPVKQQCWIPTSRTTNVGRLRAGLNEFKKTAEDWLTCFLFASHYLRKTRFCTRLFNWQFWHWFLVVWFENDFPPVLSKSRDPTTKLLFNGQNRRLKPPYSGLTMETFKCFSRKKS